MSDTSVEFFNVYRTPTAIELRQGMTLRENIRLICTHKSYQTAQAFAERLAEQTGLEFKDYTPDIYNHHPESTCD